MNRRRFLTVCAAVIAMPGQARSETVQWQSLALGGTVRVDLRGPRALSERLDEEIAALIAEVERAASLYRPDSALSRLNATGLLADPPPALSDLISLADRVHRETAGAFDPTVQPLWRALAEGRNTSQARALIGWTRVRLGDPLRLGDGQALTLNGIAQGYTADRVRSLLAVAGYTEALIDMGELAAIGGPFRVAIEDPAAGPVAIRTMAGTAMATSSPTAMRIGPAFHILGPDGRHPLWSTVTVEATSAALADALSTAFCLMEADSIRAVTARMAEVVAVTVIDHNGDFATL